MVKRRWMRAALSEAAASKVHLPWQRGLRRQEMIARRGKVRQEPARRQV